MPRPSLASRPLTAQQEQIVRMRARGMRNPEIIKELWGLERGQPGFHSAELKIGKLLRHPDVPTIWRDELRKYSLPLLSEAVTVLKRQMRSDEKSESWLRNKAANDIMAFVKPQVFGDEEKTVTVRIDGMPDLGSPDDGESGTAE